MSEIDVGTGAAPDLPPDEPPAPRRLVASYLVRVTIRHDEQRGLSIPVPPTNAALEALVKRAILTGGDTFDDEVHVSSERTDR